MTGLSGTIGYDSAEDFERAHFSHAWVNLLYPNGALTNLVGSTDRARLAVTSMQN
jgi:hypothetical protein